MNPKNEIVRKLLTDAIAAITKLCDIFADKPTEPKRATFRKPEQKAKIASREKLKWQAWELTLLDNWLRGNVRKGDKTIDYLVRKLGRTPEAIDHKIRDLKKKERQHVKS